MHLQPPPRSGEKDSQSTNHRGQEVPNAMSDAAEPTLTLSVEEAARLLGISPGLAYQLVHRGELAAIKLGRRILVPRHAVEALIGQPDTAA
jgi:excisionase family DNA binding protein